MAILRDRAECDYERRLQTEAIRQLIAGEMSPDSDWPVARGIEYIVVAVQVTHDEDSEHDIEWACQRIGDALRLRLATTFRGAVAAPLGDRVYAVVALTNQAGNSSTVLLQRVRDFIDRFASAADQMTLRAGIGSAALSVSAIPRSRRHADFALEVTTMSADAQRVATIGDVGAEALQLRFRAQCAADPELGGAAVQRVTEHDRKHHTALTRTLETWLECNGDFEMAAERLGVHTNTVRYRIRQMRTSGLINLDSPAERIAAYLHLKATHPSE